MERNRQVKILSIVALVLAITGMTLGFAAFSTTLNISSSASVSPNSDDFKLKFCDSTSASYCSGDWVFLDSYFVSDGANYNGSAGFDSKWVYDVGGSFTAPNQKVIYKLYIHNVGEYDAYLRGIIFTPLDNGTYKKCSATTSDSTKATDSLVQAACDGIKISVNIGGEDYELGNDTISGHLLSKGTYEEMYFTVEYLEGSAYADGPLKVDISDFKLSYSTVNSSKLITFIIGGTLCQAEEGMTWEEWVNSDYNEKDFYCSNGNVRSESYHLCNVYCSDVIVAEKNYAVEIEIPGEPT